MRAFVLILLLIPFITFGQSSENSEEVSEWTNVSYVDLDNDIISSSNVSVGFLGEFTILSYNLSYEWEKGKHSNGIFFSHTPSFKYKKIGYNYGKTKEFDGGLVRTNNYSLTLSHSRYSDDALMISPFFNQMYEKNNYRFGYTLFINDYSWDNFELNGQLYDAAANQKYSMMIIGMKEFDINKWVLRPEFFMLSNIRTHYFTIYEDALNPLDIWYWNDFNVNLYYGFTIDYHITKLFTFGGKFRSCLSYDIADIDLGYIKSTPYIITLGGNYDF